MNVQKDKRYNRSSYFICFDYEYQYVSHCMFTYMITVNLIFLKMVTDSQCYGLGSV